MSPPLGSEGEDPSPATYITRGRARVPTTAPPPCGKGPFCVVLALERVGKPLPRRNGYPGERVHASGGRGAKKKTSKIVSARHEGWGAMQSPPSSIVVYSPVSLRYDDRTRGPSSSRPWCRRPPALLRAVGMTRMKGLGGGGRWPESFSVLVSGIAGGPRRRRRRGGRRAVALIA